MNQTTSTALSPKRIIGFSCYQGFIYAVFYMGANRALHIGDFAVERADLLATLLGMVLVFAIMAARPKWAKKILGSDAALAACAFMLTAGALVPSLSETPNYQGVFFEGLFIGLPMAVLLIAWGRVLGYSSPRTAAFEIFASTGIAAAVCFIATFCGPEAPFALSIVLPAASTGILLVSGAGSASTARSQAPLDAGESDQTSRSEILTHRMLAGAGMFGLAAGLMETFRSNPGASSTPMFASTLLILALFCIPVLQSLRGKSDPRDESLGSAYRIAILVTLAGFLFIPVFYNSGVPGEAIVLAGCLGLTASLIALFIAVSVLRGIDSAMAFCRGFGFLYAGEALGIIAGNAIDSLGFSSEIQYGMTAFAGLAMLVAYLFLFTENDFVELSAIVDATESENAMFDAIVAEAKLSQRESEVLALALKGRTNERIAQELYVAKSTVDTHLRRIYSKAGVHSRQELLDYGEDLVQHPRR